MYKVCSKCGKIHDINYVCHAGDVKTETDMFRQSYRWRCKSKEIRKRARYMCEVCAANGIYSADRLEVHHIKKARYNKALRFDNYNLISLCPQCHKAAEEGEIGADYLIDLAKKRENEGY